MFATFAGIPVSVASSTCYAQDLTVPVGGTRPQDAAQAYNLVNALLLAIIAAGWFGLELQFWHLFLSSFLQGGVNSLMREPGGRASRMFEVGSLVPNFTRPPLMPPRNRTASPLRNAT